MNLLPSARFSDVFECILENGVVLSAVNNKCYTGEAELRKAGYPKQSNSLPTGNISIETQNKKAKTSESLQN